MRSLLIALLLLNAVCLFSICQPLPVLAGSGSGEGPVDACEGDPTKYALDTNDDGTVDLSDFVGGLSWFFSGGTAPRVCLDTTDLEANLAQAQGERDAALTDLETANGQVTTLTGERDAAETAQATAEDALATAEDALTACLAPPPPPAGFTFVETNTQGYPEYTHDSSGIRFVRLPGGSFEMGSPESEAGRFTDEGPVHTVSLSPFLIAKYETTQAEYAAVMTGNTAGLNATPSGNFGSAAASDQRPVETVSWDDLHLDDSFLERTGLVLPSEAQWEYACRAGTSGPYAGTGVIDDMGWYSGNSGGSTHDVGGKQANQFGLHDMHGNVFEWCRDSYDGAFYGSDFAYGRDPLSTNPGSGRRVYRGGFFSDRAQGARSAGRIFSSPTPRFLNLGFRPARPLP